MVERHLKRCGFAWLELLVTISLLTLGALLFPNAASAALRHIDPRQWGRVGWIGLNCLVIIALLGMRFRHALKQARRSLFARRRGPDQLCKGRGEGESHQDYGARVRRDAEWRERAKKRRPFL